MSEKLELNLIAAKVDELLENAQRSGKPLETVYLMLEQQAMDNPVLTAREQHWSGKLKEFCAASNVPVEDEMIRTTIRQGFLKGKTGEQIYQLVAKKYAKMATNESNPKSRGGSSASSVAVPSVPPKSPSIHVVNVPMPSDASHPNDPEFWRKELQQAVDKSAFLSNPTNAFYVSQPKLEELIESCRKFNKPYATLYHQLQSWHQQAVVQQSKASSAVDEGQAVKGQYMRRIRRFCVAHHLAQTDADIQRMMKETLQRGNTLEELMQRLVQKYGSEPQNAGPVDPNERQAVAQRLKNYMSYYNLDASDEEIEKMLLKVEGKRKPYSFLFQRLVSQYGPEPAAHHRVQQPGSRNVSGRQDAEARLIAFGKNYSWNREVKELREMLDAAERRGDYDYSNLFQQLRETWGPEPTSALAPMQLPPSKVRDGYKADDDDDERLNPKDKQQRRIHGKLVEYCQYYHLNKSRKEYEQILNDFEEIGWDVMFDKLSKKFGPVPWSVEEHERILKREGSATAPRESIVHVNNVSKDGTQKETMKQLFAMANLSEKQKLQMLSLYNTTFNIGWGEAEMRRMVESLSGTSAGSPQFLELLVALENRYGPLPLTESGQKEAEHVFEDDTDAMEKLKRLGIDVPDVKARNIPSVSGRNRRLEDERIFWRDRIKAFLDFYAPEESFTWTDVENLVGQFEKNEQQSQRFYPTQFALYEAFWEQLLRRFGPEPALPLTTDPQAPTSVGADPFRRYWYLKFKHYCEYYNISKSPYELERMLDRYEGNGWSLMYDKLVEVHGPPPPIPLLQVSTDEKLSQPPHRILSAEEWREKLRRFCTEKFPEKSSAEIGQYLSNFEHEQGSDSLEALFSTLVLLHGPSMSSALRNPIKEKVHRIIVTLTGVDFGIYQIASPTSRTRFCAAIAADVAGAMRIGNDAVLIDGIQPHGQLVTVDIIIQESRAGATDELIRRVTSGYLSLDSVRRSYVEDLGGNAFALCATGAAAAEIHATPSFDTKQVFGGYPGQKSVSLASPEVRVNPLDTLEKGGKIVAGQGVHLSTSRRSDFPEGVGDASPLHPTSLDASWVQPAAPSAEKINEQARCLSYSSEDSRRSFDHSPYIIAPSAQTSPQSAAAYSLRQQRLRGGTPQWNW